MFVRFDYLKCLEAAGVLLSTTEIRTMGRMRLLKLLYLANRKSLIESGDPIVDDDAVAMAAGPVLSHTYDLIKGTEANARAQAAWKEYFEDVRPYLLRMVAEPGTDHLSDYDVKTLKNTADEFKDMEDFDLSEYTHQFDEWRRNWDGKHNVAPISAHDLLSAIGYTEQEITGALKEARSLASEQDLLGCR